MGGCLSNPGAGGLRTEEDGLYKAKLGKLHAFLGSSTEIVHTRGFELGRRSVCQKLPAQPHPAVILSVFLMLGSLDTGKSSSEWSRNQPSCDCFVYWAHKFFKGPETWGVPKGREDSSLLASARSHKGRTLCGPPPLWHQDAEAQGRLELNRLQTHAHLGWLPQSSQGQLSPGGNRGGAKSLQYTERGGRACWPPLTTQTRELSWPLGLGQEHVALVSILQMCSSLHGSSGLGDKGSVFPLPSIAPGLRGSPLLGTQAALQHIRDPSRTVSKASHGARGSQSAGELVCRVPAPPSGPLPFPALGASRPRCPDWL